MQQARPPPPTHPSPPRHSPSCGEPALAHAENPSPSTLSHVAPYSNISLNEKFRKLKRSIYASCLEDEAHSFNGCCNPRPKKSNIYIDMEKKNIKAGPHQDKVQPVKNGTCAQQELFLSHVHVFSLLRPMCSDGSER